MARSQRVVALALAAIVAVVAVLLLGGGDDEERPSAGRATSAPAPEATRTPQELEPRATPAPPPLLTAGRERALTFEQGDQVRFRVRADAPEEVHVHGYDIERRVPAGQTVTIAFDGELAGIFDVELHESGAPLGRLRIEP